MSREIKFRAWDLDNKWMDDHFFIQSNGIAHDVPSRTFDTPNIEIEENPNLIVMQFTGLRDVNGVDIYEGDIISSNFYGDNVDWDDVAEISYCSKKAKYVFNKEEGEQDAFVEGVECGCLKVIGNIHQNKDLIK